MSTANELKTYLSKRGIDVDVDKVGDTYLVSITSKKVDDVVNLLATIHEPGRFIVAVKLDDIIPVIGDILGIVKLKQDFDNHAKNSVKMFLDLEELMRGNSAKLVETDDELKKRDGDLDKRATDLEEQTKQLIEDMSVIKKQPWWKRFLGVK
jgi:hypothetical protein